MRPHYVLCSVIALVSASEILAPARVRAADAKPAVLLVNGTRRQPGLADGDFEYFKRLNQHGFQLDVHFLDEQPARPLNWQLIRRYNCLVILDLPPDEHDAENWVTSWDKVPPYKKEMLSLLDAYLAKGGGVFLMPNLRDRGFRGNKKIEDCLARWGARLPYEWVRDPATLTQHPRNLTPFVYTQKIAQTPVSEGVKGIWFPGAGWMSYFSLAGTPLALSTDWTEVVRGSDTSFTESPPVEQKNG